MSPEAAIPAFDLQRQWAEIGGEVEAAVQRVLRSGRYVLGPEGEAFERELAETLGVREAVGVGSGTDGLFLALTALHVRPGDEVITTPFTFFATVAAILRAGARPVFADIDPQTLNLDPAAAEAAVTPRTKAILPVDLFGQPAAMDSLRDLADRRGLLLVEDAAQAIGARWNDRPVGFYADAAVISFYPTKNLGGVGEGGAVVTQSPAVAREVRILRNQGMEDRRYYYSRVGINGRLDEVQAAALRVKLRHLHRWNQRRRELAARYEAGIARLATAGAPVRPVACHPRAFHVYHQYSILTERRDDLRAFLAARGIGTQVYYPVLLPETEALRHLDLPPATAWPNARLVVSRILSLPMFPELTLEEVDRVVGAIGSFFGASLA